MNYQGFLRDAAGAPADGSHDLTASIWDDATGGTRHWIEIAPIDVQDGLFEVVLGEIDPIDATIFDTGPMWLEIEVDGELLDARQELASVPWALHAATAEVAYSVDPSATFTWQVPLGAIVDWYAFSSTDPVPEGYAICNGSVVSDPESPFDGKTLPNLVGAFAMGVGTVAEVGTSGGLQTATHSHSHTIPGHDHTLSHTHSIASHTHSIGGTTGTRDLDHQHRWARSDAGTWKTHDSAGTLAAYGLDSTPHSSGSGFRSIQVTGTWSESFYTSVPMNDSGSAKSLVHDHSLPATTGGAALTSGGASSATTSKPALTTDPDSPSHDNRPPYVGLLKIMRIK